jgi:N-acetylglutamate synthase-like GNAT family acetyltransferase
MSKNPVPEIRQATIGDADQISLVSVHLGYTMSSNEIAKNRLMEIIESASDHIWVYEENKKIKGWLHLFISLRLASPEFAEIGGLVVDKACRRSGIGKKLVGQAIEFSRFNNMPLRVRCNAAREEANKFYESIGFECIKTQKVHQICS